MRFSSLFALAAVAASIAAPAAANDELSTVLNGDAPLLSPASGLGYYDGLPTTATAPSADARITALARALNYDPDLIYEHVRNHIEYTPTFGVSKGAVGALVDEAGTAFDQAQLMVALLRVVNPATGQATPARYKLGQLTLDGAEFAAWFGVTNAKAACNILADGAIPATVNGSTNCSSLSGNASSVVLAHVWVEAQIGASWHAFDPARKDYETIAGVGLSVLKTQMGFSATTLDSTASASTGSASGVTWASNINYSGIESYLGARANVYVSYLKANHPAASLEEIIGGRRIKPSYGPPLRQASVPDQTAVNKTWTGDIPDVYRIKLTIDVAGCGEPPNDGQDYTCVINEAQCGTVPAGAVNYCNDFRHTTFADELAGRRVALGPVSNAAGQNDIHLFVDGDSVASLSRPLHHLDPFCQESGGLDRYLPGGSWAYAKLGVDMPYAADSGDYMDRDFETHADADEPAILIAEFGDRRPGKGYDSVREQRRDRVYPSQPALFYTNWEVINPVTFPGSYLPRVGSDQQRATMAKSYFDQLAQLRRIIEALFSARTQAHYAVGLVWSRNQTSPAFRSDAEQPPGEGPHGCQPMVMDAATSFDLVSGVSVNALNGDVAASKRYAHLVISGGAMLEGSVGEQATDTPVVLNTQSRFKWASENVTGEKFYLVTPSNVSTAQSLGLVADIFHVQPYTAAGYSVLVPASTDLGPGPTQGVKFATTCSSATACTYLYRESNYRGGAFVAFDAAAGSAAYMVEAGGWLKGGGATEDYDEFDPTQLPDVMEEDYGLRAGFADGVSLANGELTYQPAPDLVTGSGPFPYSLAFQRKFKAGDSRSRGLTHGWTHNWDMRASFGGDGMEALGAANPQNAAAAISALLAADAILDSTWDARRLLALQIIENWQREKMAYNTVTLIRGNDTTQFFRLPDGSFNPPAGQAGTLAQSGSRKFHLNKPDSRCPAAFSPNEDNKPGMWSYENISLTYTSPMGDKQTYESYYWSGTPYDAFNTDAVNLCNTGHRISSWTFPQGVTLSFAYGSGDLGADRARLLSVSNGLGRSLSFTYTGEPSKSEAMTVTAGAGDGRSATVTTTQTTRADGTVMKYLYAWGANLFYYLDADFSDLRPMPWPHLATVYAASDQTTPHLTIDYDEAWRVESITDKRGETWSFRIAGSRGAVIDPLGAESARWFDQDGREVRSVSPLGDVMEKVYNGIGLPIEERQYIGGGVCANAGQYDARTTTAYNTKWWQASSQSQHPAECKSGVALTAQTAWLTDYPLPSSETDARGNQTTYEYVLKSYGGASTKLLSAVNGPMGERTEYVYGAAGNGRPTQKKVKVSGTAWETVNYGWAGLNLTGRTVDPGGLNITTAFGYDGIGNATSVTDPNGNVTSIDYDLMRRATKVTRPLGAITQVIHDADGKVTKVCDAVVASPGDCAASPADWAVTAYAYTPTFKVGQVTDPDGFVTSTFYDAADRPMVTVDAAGRQTRTVYDAAGQVVKEIRAWAGTTGGIGELDCAVMRAATAADPDVLQQCYRTAAYIGASGQLAFVEDARGNRTTYSYDAYGRLEKTCFPSKTTPGTSSATDCETYAYDANGNMTAKLTRRGYDPASPHFGEQIAYVYDASNRLTERVVPGAAGGTPYTFAYDLAGRQTVAHNFNAYVNSAYDAGGRLMSSAQGGQTVSYAYDAAGNVTHLTYPDGFVLRYTYDALNRVERVRQVNAPSDAGYLRQFAHITYDTLSRRTMTALAPDNGFNSAARYAYTKRGDLVCLDWNFAGTRPAACGSGTAEVAYDFSYNPVGQLKTETVSDTALFWSPPGGSSETYASNGLNQYTAIAPLGQGAATPAYDGNGNIATDHRGRTFAYDAENVLYSATDAGGAALSSYLYYADGTRRLKNAGGFKTRHYYAGDQEILETGVLAADVLRRYIRLPGSVDEPLLMIDYTLDAGCTLTSAAACERYVHQNRLGSVVAVTDSAGAVVETYRYSPYGVSGAEGNAGFPFRFTGQKLDPETGLYYYKARYYDPETGRFLQIDPIGYEDQMNLYAYVGNDPVNAIDPTGEFIFLIPIALAATGTAGTISGGTIVAAAAAATAAAACVAFCDNIVAMAKRNKQEKNKGKNQKQKSKTQRGDNRQKGDDPADSAAKQKERGERRSRPGRDKPKSSASAGESGQSSPTESTPEAPVDDMVDNVTDEVTKPVDLPRQEELGRF